MNRQVLFTRNSDIYDDRDTAIAAIPSIVNEHGMDGCEIHVRYAKGDKIKTILVAVANKYCYSYYEEAEPLDETPTEGSGNGVTSGGVYNALKTKTEIRRHETRSNFPEVGDESLIYIDEDSNSMWRWDGEKYVAMSSLATNTIIAVENVTDSVSSYGCTLEDLVYDYINGHTIPICVIFSVEGKIIGNCIFSHVITDNYIGNITTFVFWWKEKQYCVTIDLESQDKKISLEIKDIYEPGNGIAISNGVISCENDRLDEVDIRSIIENNIEKK